MATVVRTGVAPRRMRRQVAVLIAAIGLGSCADLLAPSESGSLYVLTTIGDQHAPVANLIHLLYPPYEDHGSYIFIVAESVTFYVGGRGDMSTTHRLRDFAPPPAVSEPERRYTRRWKFRYEWYGPDLILKLDDRYTLCDPTCREYRSGIENYQMYRRGRWGALEMPWPHGLRAHYELMRGGAAP